VQRVVLLLFTAALAACGRAEAAREPASTAVPTPTPILVGDGGVDDYLDGVGSKLVSYLRVTDDLTTGVVDRKACNTGLLRLDAIGLAPDQLGRVAAAVPDSSLAGHLQTDIDAVVELLVDCVMAPATLNGDAVASARSEVDERLAQLGVVLD
jgi:hypothetical protein